jgi:precorrin-6Y C5,15-methyltransferase (decarboxylating)
MSSLSAQGTGSPEAIAADAGHHAVSRRWLSIVGIGEDGLDGVSAAGRRLIADADLVVGGARQLALAGDLVKTAMPWPSPLLGAIPQILGHRGRPVCVLASGDPFSYGIGATLAAHVPAEEMLCLPAPSAFSLAAARLAWPLQTTTCLSVHGRPLELLIPHLQPGARVLALSWDARTPRDVADLLIGRGMGGSRLTVLERMGGAHERVRTSEASSAAFDGTDALNTLAIEVVAGRGARIVPLSQGLADDLFEHAGQITKREVRAVTLSSLAPRRGELLWDIGAGSGSIGIEWMLAHVENRAIAIEPRADRVALCARNAAALGVPDLRIVAGRAPEALADLPTPHAIFVGGGGGDDVFDAAMAVLPANGRLVANAVTLATEARLAARHAAHGGTLTRIGISRAEALGDEMAWHPARPITQWSWVKP